jgi:hypothetical protein
MSMSGQAGVAASRNVAFEGMKTSSGHQV